MDRVPVGEADEKEKREPAYNQYADRYPDPGGPEDVFGVLTETSFHLILLRENVATVCNLRTVER
jgi:hypothetical protein